MSAENQFDRIERETTIAASPSRVWALVSEPGWWINDGTIINHRMDPDGADRVVVHDPDHGAFAVQKVDEQPQNYVAFRWYSGPSESRRRGDLSPRASTLVEFFVSAAGEGATRLRVIESGFAQLEDDQRDRRMMFEKNTFGWGLEFAAVRSYFKRERS